MGPSNVYAFEPQPKSRKTLRSLFPEVHLSELALSDGRAERQLRVPYLDGKECPTRASLEVNDEPAQTGSEFLSVKTSTLDAFVAEQGLGRVAFVKIDVEGHETKVLRGASPSTLPRCSSRSSSGTTTNLSKASSRSSPSGATRGISSTARACAFARW